jgi:hypothetical protein
MWIHLPSECYPFAQELPDSTWDSNSLAQNLAQSVTVKGKHIASKSWLRELKKDSLTTHRFGQTLSPSTATLGATKWIASLADIPVSPSPALAKSLENKTSAGCGITLPELLAKSSPSGVSSRTSAHIYEWALNKSMMTYKQWVTELRQECLQRQKLAQDIKEKGSFCWPTPSASDGGGRLKENMLGWMKRRIRQKATNSKLGDLHMPLTMAVRLWDVGMKVIPPGHRWTWASLPDLIIQYGGNLNPTTPRLLNPKFAEWLMGLPVGWTACGAVGMPSFLSWQRLHSMFLGMLLNKINKKSQGN